MEFLFFVEGEVGALSSWQWMLWYLHKLPSKQIPRTVLSASARKPVTAFPSQSEHASIAFGDLRIFPQTGAWCWGQIWQCWAGMQREHGHQRVKVSWELISACCLDVARVRVMPGKDLRGVWPHFCHNWGLPGSAVSRKGLPGLWTSSSGAQHLATQSFNPWTACYAVLGH